MKSIVAGLGLVAFSVPAYADIFVSPKGDSTSTLVVAALLAGVSAVVLFARKRQA